ncbi:hypothetical protein PGT21_010385 [Puccinia graminis f. sp. tritici]|uniref:Uncharacterized protein n=1 Tax=Puccinia graminis f. sp. tritici TaxID=56615 RepID=A0A5B0LNM1_PUCGR|nr:hypothetical protein PGT21_010385 [Puccinia graminis f. sp. tritici]KAA1132343.1 hypothetical protein PGTUg99_005050 [Puccinia graminis f. sp. tritici]
MNQQEQEQEQEEQQQEEPIKQPTHQQLRLKHYIILSSLSLSFLLLAIIHITIGERLNNNSPSRIQDSLRLNIPSTRLKIGELTAQNSLSLSIQTNLTLDLHQLTSSKNRLGKTVEGKLLRWLVAQSPNATLSSSSPIQIYEADNHGDQEPLLELTLLEPFILPLSYTLPSKHPDDNPSPPPTQRTTIALRIQFRAPDRLPPLLLTPALDLRVVIKDLDLRLNPHNGLPAWIARLFTHVSLPHLALQLSLPLPKLPASWTDPSKLLQIDSYSFYPLSAGSTTDDEPEPKVGIRASVSAPNPLQLLKQYIDELDLQMHITWPIPLSIFLLPPPSNHSSSSLTDPQSVPLASSLTLPFLLDANSEQVSITIEGFLLPSLASSPHNPSAPQEQEGSALSGFLNRFLKGKTNDLLIRYRGDQTAAGEVSRGLLSTEGGGRAAQHRFSIGDDEGPKQERVPSLVVAFLAALNVRLQFPGNEHTELVESIGVREMKIDLPSILPPHPHLLCSGELRAVVVLPPHLVGLSSILSILDVRPNVLLLDGPLPSSNSSSLPPQPDDDQVVLPETAFARLFPEHYLPASLRLILPNSTTSSASSQVKLLLTSSFVKLPLQVLEGRTALFRRYAAKYLLHHRRHQSPDGDDDQEGVLTSIVGAFDAHSSIAHTFLVQLLGVDVRGSFYV